jgi:hypothetical protein
VIAILFAGLSIALIFVVLIDGFESMILPRRVARTFRFARLFYLQTWGLWRAAAARLPRGRHRESFLSWFGPFSLLLLFGSWVTVLIIGFGLLSWSLNVPLNAPEGDVNLGTYVYMSGTTFFTLGYGDVTPLSRIGRLLTVLEAGMGFAFLASVIGYLPVLYQSFARREVTISLLDARAGSPPSAFYFLQRMALTHSSDTLRSFLAEWERWAAEVLESHLSYPMLSLYRSQHDNQSWVAALTAMLDTCAVLLAAVKETCGHQAQLTFAMARHVAVDISMALGAAPHPPSADRLPGDAWQRFRERLAEAGFVLHGEAAALEKLVELRAMYEPFVNALAERLLFHLPAFYPERPAVDNWQTSAWMRRTPGIGKLPLTAIDDEHFD